MDNYILNSNEYSKALDTLLSMVPQKQLKLMTEATTTCETFVKTLRTEEVNNKVSAIDATLKGEEILLLIIRLSFLIPPSSRSEDVINMLAISTALWVVQRDGSIKELTMIVNGISSFANHTKIDREIEELYEISLYILFATDPNVKTDKNKIDDQRPWRLLCLNHCIIATRTGNSSIARSAYDLLLEHLPEEADNFFSLAMQKVATGAYPVAVVDTVETYYQKYSRGAANAYDENNIFIPICSDPYTVH